LNIQSNLDIDECGTRGHNCHKDALCGNTEGSFKCSCKGGFLGDGVTCTVKPESDICSTCESTGFTKDTKCGYVAVGRKIKVSTRERCIAVCKRHKKSCAALKFFVRPGKKNCALLKTLYSKKCPPNPISIFSQRCEDVDECIEEDTNRILVEPTWGRWSGYSSCSSSCGVGTKTRQRSCQIGAVLRRSSCRGPQTKTVQCNGQPCGMCR